jgi:hypothetical protein
MPVYLGDEHVMMQLDYMLVGDSGANGVRVSFTSLPADLRISGVLHSAIPIIKSSARRVVVCNALFFLSQPTITFLFGVSKIPPLASPSQALACPTEVTAIFTERRTYTILTRLATTGTVA